MKSLTSIAMVTLAIGVSGLSAREPVAQQRKGHEPHATHSGSGVHGHMQEMQEMNEKMVKRLGSKDARYEQRFIDMMIPHHEGAIMMAEHALKHATRPELRQMAEKIIKAQEKEIEQLKQWRKEWYGK